MNRLQKLAGLNEIQKLSMNRLAKLVYQYEIEASGQEFADKQIIEISKIKNADDVEGYYGERGWNDEWVIQALKYFIDDLLKNK
jgi:hypothetical protein